MVSAAPVTGCVWEEMRFPYGVYRCYKKQHPQTERTGRGSTKILIMNQIQEPEALLTMQSLTYTHKCTEIEKKKKKKRRSLNPKSLVLPNNTYIKKGL